MFRRLSFGIGLVFIIGVLARSAKGDSYDLYASISQPPEFAYYETGSPFVNSYQVWFLSSHTLQYWADPNEWVDLDCWVTVGCDSTVVEGYVLDGPVQMNPNGLYSWSKILSKEKYIDLGQHDAWAETNLTFPDYPGYDSKHAGPNGFTVAH